MTAGPRAPCRTFISPLPPSEVRMADGFPHVRAPLPADHEGAEDHARYCPRDHALLEPGYERQSLTGAMAILAGAAVEIDRCPECHGAFFDQGELGRVTGNAALDDFLSWGKTRPEEGAPCPGCGSAMAIRGFRGVVLDACPSCGGLWFDAGENERMRDAPAPRVERWGSGGA